jgi:hypothetical protein
MRCVLTPALDSTWYVCTADTLSPRIPKTGQYTLPPSVEQSVRLRDTACFITGAPLEADLDLCWIFPPTWAYLVALVRFRSVAHPNYESSWTSGVTRGHVIMRLFLRPRTRA